MLLVSHNFSNDMINSTILNEVHYFSVTLSSKYSFSRAARHNLCLPNLTNNCVTHLNFAFAHGESGFIFPCFLPLNFLITCPNWFIFLRVAIRPTSGIPCSSRYSLIWWVAVTNPYPFSTESIKIWYSCGDVTRGLRPAPRIRCPL
jgi:hypothetical protein